MCTPAAETGAQFQHLASSMGVSLTRVTGGSVPALLAGCRPNTRMILVESPANPGLATLDLRTLAAACHLRGKCAGPILGLAGAARTAHTGAALRRHAANAHAIAAMLRRQFAWLDWTGAWNGADARRNRVRTRLHTGLMALHFAHRGQGGAFVDALQDIPVLPSFGNPETGVFHYGGVVEDADALAACEIPPGLVRLSVGIEDPRDLLAALVPALRRVS
ncbi:hypothetical protein RZA67_04380 [Stenotrophomonas sp. C3(2023)]|uniref:PLP-dependent transferase n=1 Tax=Stenotrophomonas sp. C3(2023) TaxID=3080277 RepID=UPI00293C6C8E|nr:PLP-dependent transferase [Stenotrophomonas sp. C3(2023)]MDV3467971.1 hypothetical protein [Stenotrophomonas sp. C3(2023)]